MKLARNPNSDIHVEGPLFLVRHKVEQLENWRGISPQIPSFSFDKDYLVHFAPPMLGAICRFGLRHKDAPDHAWLSVYLDWYGALGAMPEPYWEAHPVFYKDEETGKEYWDAQRYDLNEEGLSEALMRHAKYFAKSYKHHAQFLSGARKELNSFIEEDQNK